MQVSYFLVQFAAPDTAGVVGGELGEKLMAESDGVAARLHFGPTG